MYFVKGRGAGYQTMIKEIVAGRLGTMFGLPVPPITVINVPSELVLASSFPEIAELGSGPAFASQYVEYAQEFSSINCPRVLQALRMRTFLFDWWIQNKDRILVDGAGNPNLLWRAQEEAMHVIDHTSAFDSHFDKGRFVSSHVFREDHVLLLGRNARSEMTQAMHEVMRNFS